MAANNSLVLSSLDFDTLKSNLKSYLQNQSVFKDYDFESSNINVLLSLLSYNTYLNSFYLNMVASESFMDSAQMLDSVVSHAKLLNYVPSSSKSPKGSINITFTAIEGITDNFTIPKGTQFSGTNANGTFTYVTDRSHSLYSPTGVFAFKNIDIYEGSYVNETLIVDESIENQRFILSNPNIDVDSLAVTVYENGSITPTDFKKTDTLYGLNANSNIYFVQAYKNQYEVVFGDNSFGRRPNNGSTILATYRVTNAMAGGGVSTFFLDQNVGALNGGTSTHSITTATTSDAGAEAESLESIRFRAPRAYQAQGRAITTADYNTLIIDQFPEIKSMNVYGGETETTGVNYGKVYIVPITYAGTALSENRKNDVVRFIKDKMTIGLTPVVTDPEFLYVVPSITVTFDPTITNYTPNDINGLVYTSVLGYNDTYLKSFNVTFRDSKFIEALNNSDVSIVSSIANIKIKKVTSPPLYKKIPVDLTFNQPLVPGTIYSTPFLLTDGLQYSFTDYNPLNDTFNKVMIDNELVETNSSNIIYLKLNDVSKQVYIEAGTIDYATGSIAFTSLDIADFLNSPGIVVYAKPYNDDIIAKNNDLIEIDTAATEITVKTL